MNIALIGMPASGKTTIALELYKLLSNYTVVDTDEKIVHNENKNISEIFAQKGEEYFRNIETKILKEVLKCDNQIISTGGGIIKSDDNLKLLKNFSKVIYLKTSIDTLLVRASYSKDRPLLNKGDIKEKLEKLLIERENKYEKAHYIIETDGKTAENIAKEVLKKLNENGRS